MHDKQAAQPDRSLAALILAFVLAAAHQYLFYGVMPGISYPIFVCLFYAYTLYIARDQIRKPTWIAYLWLGVIVLLSLTYVLFYNQLFYTLNLAVIPVLIVLHMTYMLRRERPAWASWTLIGQTLEHLFPQTLRHWATAARMVRGGRGKGIQPERKQVLVKILFGLCIAFPLLLVVVSLLGAADGVFQQMLGQLPELLARASFGEGIGRTLWLVLLGLGFFGLVWGYVVPHKYNWNERPAGLEGVLEPVVLRMDPVILTTVLVAVNAVYVLFVFVQFTYLFGAWDGVLPAGSSYAEYARSGFFELVLVTGINFVILMFALLPANSAVTPLLRRMISLLLYVLVGCSLVMLYSAFTRLTLYEEAYGYTYIRFLVHACMLMLGLLLVLAAVRIGREHFPLVKCSLVVLLLGYVLMNYLNMDDIIAKQNVARYQTGGEVDADYLSRLGPGATKVLIRFSRDHEGVLDSYLRADLETETGRSWQSFNAAKYSARRALENYFNH
ncbi:DUF4153 domain-containing protein [Paenibacillus donghaensis]|uniref:Uncharacterized protein n=1 Tax=Paenibacillus donghaensis TaxID=414771 RepID=A0A2Z2KPW6_9BACL|nr:DUF4173 domain-containing protein [Paenibacillus donghaensis]ASA20848.1 hypothetical protein B9T62_08675 [Paenibacillus donghaensis]